MEIKKIVLNIPHSRTFVPKEVSVNPQMNAAIWEKTDWLTDKIFLPDKGYWNYGVGLTNWCVNVKAHIFPYSRCYCDVVRSINDPLEAQGRGIIYDFGEKISEADRQKRYFIYNQYRHELSKSIIEGTLLIDCHSFSDESEFDICIGYNEDETKPDQNFLDYVVNYFQQKGFKVGINEPYSNSITVDAIYRPAVLHEDWRWYRSMMIEVNQRVYLRKEGIKPGTWGKECDWSDPDLASCYPYQSNLMSNLYRRILENDMWESMLKLQKDYETLFKQNFDLFFQNRNLIINNPDYYELYTVFDPDGEYHNCHPKLGYVLSILDKEPELYNISWGLYIKFDRDYGDYNWDDYHWEDNPPPDPVISLIFPYYGSIKYRFPTEQKKVALPTTEQTELPMLITPLNKLIERLQKLIETLKNV
jgi:N-formylglutamate amidohydrolase